MEANELRIGNLVNGTLGIDNVLTVESILSSTLIAFLHSDDKEILYEYQLENLKPIQLTTEWLTRFGLIKRQVYDGVYAYEISGHFQIQYYEGKYYLGMGYGGDNKDLQYIHQLQNLYFALTGSELILKP